MNNSLLCAAIALLVSTAACAADAPGLKADKNDAADQQLMKVERAWNEALKNRDKDAFASICSQDFLFTAENGQVLDMKRFIAESTTRLKVNEYKISEPVVRSYGETGIVSALWKGSVEVDGQQSDVAMQFTDTFVRRDNRWWAVASHMSKDTE